MSGVWRKGVCARCGSVGYVHVAVGECNECVQTQKKVLARFESEEQAALKQITDAVDDLEKHVEDREI